MQQHWLTDMEVVLVTILYILQSYKIIGILSGKEI